MLLEVAARVGPHETLSALGAGGMGEVYRARDTKLNRDVALKILPDVFASDTRSIRGFQVRHWIRNGMSFWAVSDLNDAELGEFMHALQR